MTGLPSINVTNARGVMARHRDGRVHHSIWVGVGGVMLTASILMAIQIGGQVTQLRQDIQALGRGCDQLEARQAQLSLLWNSESSRQVVMTRAQRELNLVCPAEPGMILVTTAPEHEGSRNTGPMVELASVVVPAAYAGEQR